MEQHYNNFLTILYKFVYDLNRYVPSHVTQNALDVYKDLEMAKIIFRTYHLLKDNCDKINNKDETLFSQQFYILPGVDVSQSWVKLIKGQKDKLFTYLKILMIESDILVNQSPTPNNNIVDNKKTSNEQSKSPQSEIIQSTDTSTEIVKAQSVEFNPYVGVGENNKEQYSVNEMFSALDKMEDDKPTGPGIETIAKMMGLNKLVNLEELSNQLKNMKKEDIENATNNIKGLLGNNVDEKTTNLISDMLTNISDEMKNNDMSNGDPLKNILNIAEKVASNMKPKIEQGDIDMSQLLQSTQAFASQCTDKNGKPMFDGKMNPFALLGQFANMNNMSNMNEEQCMQQCNTMLNNLGVNGGGNMNMQQMMTQLQQSMNQSRTNQSNQTNTRGGKKPKKNNKKR
ncbi:hypothetical protein QKU48_gp0520 [Fadolivirus algeromassiliense]|jgi:hypothetical protein|uniref:Uncharacterized protein n=1 Tax=Fadolivirus FV1/VV64 TaxID=3070911 RepID=A0A7D3R1Q3_9VIRU|nr:hypothetical protein QKU48_gp0520 [Fadolivirus algeromassiliense]QKF93978.1 hypothetical protein Fadolivirus_1_520 [Fadolivirus FV1/VV64]